MDSLLHRFVEVVIHLGVREVDKEIHYKDEPSNDSDDTEGQQDEIPGQVDVAFVFEENRHVLYKYYIQADQYTEFVLVKVVLVVSVLRIDCIVLRQQEAQTDQAANEAFVRQIHRQD